MTTARGSNPAPRQALRRSADAQIHPATSKVGPTLAPVDATPAGPGSAERAEPAAPGRSAAGRKRGGSKPPKKFTGATSDVLRPAPDPDRDLLLGKLVTIEVSVPKRLRKAARTQAEHHGTTLDAVVTGLLAGWVDGS